MELRFDVALADSLSEGMVLLNRKGQVTDFNRAARPWLRDCANAQAALSQHIEHYLGSQADGALAIEPLGLAVVDPPASKAYLNRQGPDEFVLTIIPGSSSKTLRAVETSASQADPGFLHYFSAELRHEFVRWRARLDQAETHGRLEGRDASLIKHSERLSQLIVLFEQLWLIRKNEVLGQSERLSLMTLTQDTLAALPRRRADYVLMAEQANFSEQVGVLYVPADLLKCGLRGLLESLDDAAPPKSQIELWLRQSGGHVVLSSRFVNGARMRGQAPSTPVRHGAAPLRVDPGLRLPLARDIVNLFRGQLMVEEIADPSGRENARGLASFTLVLPTGSGALTQPQPDCADCPTFRQAESYAHDLASLMARPDPASEVSGEEIAFLMSVLDDTPRNDQYTAAL
jgi:hypothetical protein